MPASALVVSRHDYRTGVCSSIHRIAETLAETFDEVNVMSVGFSPLVPSGSDERHALIETANTWVTAGRVRCFLWSTPWPVMSDGALMQWLGAPAFETWAAWPCPELDAAAKRADVILVQSGPAVALIRRLRRHAPHAQIVYRVTDLAKNSGADARTRSMFARDAAMVDQVVVVARAMAPHFEPLSDRVVFVPRGLDPAFFDGPAETPYGRGRNVVAIRSRPFDASVVQIAAGSFPDTKFHLIGSLGGHRYPPNVREYGSMPVPETVRYIQHADAGIAAYSESDGSDCLVDSSLRLLQFGHLGIPAICPAFAVGDRPLRAGYALGRSASVRQALGNAFSMTRGTIRVAAPTWREVCDRMLARPDVRSAAALLPPVSRRVHHDG